MIAKPKIIIIGAGGDLVPRSCAHIETIRGKTDWWMNNMEVHSHKVSGPFVAHDRFVVQYDIDVTDKNSKERMQLSEVGVYTVKDGKIAREEFLPYTGDKK